MYSGVNKVDSGVNKVDSGVNKVDSVGKTGVILICEPVTGFLRTITFDNFRSFIFLYFVSKFYLNIIINYNLIYCYKKVT